MKPVSKIAEAVRASTTLAVDSLAKQMKADGLDVVGFGTGEPDFNTPDNINMAGIRAICDGKTKYTPAAGIIPLRKAIAQRLKEDCGVDYDYTQIVVASGAKLLSKQVRSRISKLPHSSLRRPLPKKPSALCSIIPRTPQA